MLSLAERAAQRRAERVEAILKKKTIVSMQARNKIKKEYSFFSNATTWKKEEQLLIDRLNKLRENDFNPMWAEAITQYKKEIQLGPLTLRARTGKLQWGLKKMLDFFEYVETGKTNQENAKADGAKLERSSSASKQESMFPQPQKSGHLL